MTNELSSGISTKIDILEHVDEVSKWRPSHLK